MRYVIIYMETAAEAYGTQLAGILLTGANNDGASGMRCHFFHFIQNMT